MRPFTSRSSRSRRSASATWSLRINTTKGPKAVLNEANGKATKRCLGHWAAVVVLITIAGAAIYKPEAMLETCSSYRARVSRHGQHAPGGKREEGTGAQGALAAVIRIHTRAFVPKTFGPQRSRRPPTPCLALANGLGAVWNSHFFLSSRITETICSAVGVFFNWSFSLGTVFAVLEPPDAYFFVQN
jgi:hypothetical protein